MKTFGFCVLFYVLSLVMSDSLSRYRENIIFSAFSDSYPNGTITHINDALDTFNCDPRGNTTFVVHGWLESIDRPWVRPMINEFLKLRGNCVFFMDYSVYSSGGYFVLTPHFNSIANLLSEKILKISAPQNVVLFGFSFGARLVTKAGVLIANSEATKIDRIYACDPAGPGFDPVYRLDPKRAANFIQCIHTSNTYGTKVYNCHQDWRMGVCGHKQIGAGPFPYGSHGLCPYFFLSSFSEDFIQNNAHDCRSRRLPKDLPNDLIMGPRESRLIHAGDFFAPTAKSPPWSGFIESSRKNEIDFFEDEDVFGEEYYNELKELF